MKTSTITALILGFLVFMRSGGIETPQTAIPDSDVHLVDFEDLTYPGAARVAHVQGVVVVRASLDDQGRVVDATAISGNAVLIPDTISNVEKWRFQPNAEKAVVVVYNFRMTNEESKAGCSHFSLLPPNLANVTACVPKIQ
jgi:hypothetical protein